jgi:hypothetical protein
MTALTELTLVPLIPAKAGIQQNISLLGPRFRGDERFELGNDEAYAAIASSRRLVTGGPNTPMTIKTIAIAAAMKLNTLMVP